MAYDIDSLDAVIGLGQQGEVGATEIEFDVSAWETLYPGLAVAANPGVSDGLWLTYTRSGETTVYPETASTLGFATALGVTTLTWTPSEAVLDIAGNGTVVIHLTDGGVEKRSVMTSTYVVPGHASAGTPPDPLDDWIEEWGAIDLTVTGVAHTEPAAGTIAQDSSGTHIELDIPAGHPGVYVGTDEPTDPLDTVWVDTDAVYDVDPDHWSAADVTVTTLAAGESATASVTQNATGTHFALGIPQGIQGIKGDPGDLVGITVDGAEVEPVAGVVDLTESFERYALWRKTSPANPVSVYPVPESPLYAKVSGTYTQSGAGDPSPSNIRPITPWLASGASVSVVQTDGATIALTAPSEIAAGWMDNEGRGEAVLARYVYDGTENWTEFGADPVDYHTFILSGHHIPPALTATRDYLSKCSHFLSQEMTVSSATRENFSISESGSVYFTILNSRLSEVSVAGIKAWLAAQYANGTPVTYVGGLATPIPLTLTTAPLTALPQLDRITPRQNVLTATPATSVELTYAKSPIQQANELEAAIALL